jgi:molybdate transport system ATP-binding protein
MIRAAFEKRLPGLGIEADFVVPDRGTTVLWGESGAGKTTILNCIAGLARPDAGEVEIQGKLVFSQPGGLDEATRNRGVGFVFQSYALFPHLSALDNVALALPRSERSRAAAYLERFGLAKLAKRRPATLSGGEKQRLALARALAVGPRALLLEPFSALDKATKAAMHEEFRALRDELTMSVILVSHDRAEAEYLGDRILEVKEGKALDRPR